MEKIIVHPSKGGAFIGAVFGLVMAVFLFLLHPIAGVLASFYGVYEYFRSKRNVIVLNVEARLVLYNKVGIYVTKEVTLPVQSISNIELVSNGAMGVNLKIITESRKKYNFKSANKIEAEAFRDKVFVLKNN
ncbi:MAG: hypothetical protein OCD03_02720 [Hyphomicrobiales bacterium]